MLKLYFGGVCRVHIKDRVGKCIKIFPFNKCGVSLQFCHPKAIEGQICRHVMSSSILRNAQRTTYVTTTLISYRTPSGLDSRSI